MAQNKKRQTVNAKAPRSQPKKSISAKKSATVAKKKAPSKHTHRVTNVSQSSLSLENASFDLLLPYLRELSGLRELRAPYLRESELIGIRKQLPGINVYRRRA